MPDPFILLKYYDPNIPSEEYARYSQVGWSQVLPLLRKLKPDYSNFPQGERLSREQFESSKTGCTLVRQNDSGEVWEYGDFGNKFKRAKYDSI